MRKRFITPTSESIRTGGEGWLDVDRTAVVEVTSEVIPDPTCPSRSSITEIVYLSIKLALPL